MSVHIGTAWHINLGKCGLQAASNQTINLLMCHITTVPVGHADSVEWFSHACKKLGDVNTRTEYVYFNSLTFAKCTSVWTKMEFYPRWWPIIWGMLTSKLITRKVYCAKLFIIFATIYLDMDDLLNNDVFYALSVGWGNLTIPGDPRQKQ